MSRVSVPEKAAAAASEQAVTVPPAAAAQDLGAVAERTADPAIALARVHQAAELYREAAAKLEEWRRQRQAAVLHAKAVGASAHQIAEAAGISDQRMSLILANATRPRKPETTSSPPLTQAVVNAVTVNDGPGMGIRRARKHGEA